MVKKMRVILTGFLMILFLVIANGAYLFYRFGNFLNIASGHLTKESILVFYEVIPLNYKFFILFQLLLLAVIIAIVITRKFRLERKLSKNNFIEKSGMKSKTDLDILYEMLKRKKWVTIDSIEKVFKVNSEVALGWSKILENGNLAIIDYPRFGKPVLRLLRKDMGEKLLSDKNTGNQGDNTTSEGTRDEIQNPSQENVVLTEKNKVSKNIHKKKNKIVKKRIVKKLRLVDKGVKKTSKKIKRREDNVFRKSKRKSKKR